MTTDPSRLTRQLLRPARELLGYPPVAELASGQVLAAEVQRLTQSRLEHLVEVDQPLALISQIGRSGGTLLARLFDGHPQTHVHPYELHLGRDKGRWPDIDPTDDADEVFARLSEPQNGKLFWSGYYKQGIALHGERPPADAVRAFALLPSLHRRLFHELVTKRYLVETPRDVLDCYMTSLFNAWLDYAGLRLTPKRWVVAYAPMLSWNENLDRLFATYPDGRLLAVLRDPVSWYASARTYKPASYNDLDFALRLWEHSTSEMIRARSAYPDATAIVRFADLVTRTNGTMRALATFLDLPFHPNLCEPAFNGMSVPANSSFANEGTGVQATVIRRGHAAVSTADRKAINARTGELFSEASALALTPRRPGRVATGGG